MSKPNIFFRLNGGLGNQLSQYAAAKKFEREKNIKITFDDFYLRKSKKSHEKLLLDNLFFDIFTLDTFRSKLSRFINRLLCKLNFRSKKILGFIFYFEVYPDTIDDSVITVVEGFWQTSEIYEKSVALEIYSKLNDKFYLASNVEAKTFLRTICENESAIALHVRRGDYLTNRSFFKRQQFVLPDSYYVNVVHRILNSNPVVRDIYIFSDDDIDENFLRSVKGVRITIVNRNSFSDIDTLFLISNFKTIIMANSTYSLWASILSSYIYFGKIYGPYRWHKGSTNIDILPDNIEVVMY